MVAKVGSRRLQIAAWLIALAIGAATELVFSTGALQGPEAVWSDLWFRLSGQRHAVERVALVALDEQALAAYADDPTNFWTPHLARASEVLRKVGVKTIGLDFLFSISAEKWLEKTLGHSSAAARTYDRTFRQELASRSVLIASQQVGAEPLLPAKEYLVVLPEFDVRGYVGAADLLLDADGTVRRSAPLAPGAAIATGEQLRLASFPVLLALHATGQTPHDPVWTFGSRQLSERGPAWQIPFAGPPGTVPRLSLRQLLAPGADNDPQVKALAGKVVIIGPGYSGNNDVHLTPYGHGFFNPALMYGAEIHAHTVEALLAGRFFDPLPSPLRLLALGLLLAAGLWLWTRLPAWYGTLALLALAALLAAAAYRLHIDYWTMPLAHFQLALLFLFLVLYGLRFAHGERERSRVRSMFSRYVSRDIVNALVDAEEMPALGGQALDITVFFSDIRNFTTISERLQPQETVEMLNRWFERACAVLQQEGGCIDKYIGDAIMAEFGSPLHYPDHARRAIRAALRLRVVAEEMQGWMKRRFAGRDLPPFAIGVGLHTGFAVVGNIGSSERMEYTAIGDTVNLASRLEGVTKDLGCVIAASRTTVDRAGGGVRIGKAETLRVKGRAEPVEVLAIEGLEEQ